MERGEDQQTKLAAMLTSEGSEEFSYELGEEDERTELVLTYVDGKDEKRNYSARVASSPRFKRSRDLVDITDSKGDTLRDTDDLSGRSTYISDAYGAVFQGPFRNLRLSNPPKIALEPSDSPYEMGSLVVDLEGGSKLAVSPYYRKE